MRKINFSKKYVKRCSNTLYTFHNFEQSLSVNMYFENLLTKTILYHSINEINIFFFSFIGVGINCFGF